MKGPPTTHGALRHAENGLRSCGSQELDIPNQSVTTEPFAKILPSGSSQTSERNPRRIEVPAVALDIFQLADAFARLQIRRLSVNRGL